MNISAISNSKVSFSGIYGTATKIDGTTVPINLTGDDAVLAVSDGDKKDNKRIWIQDSDNKHRTPLESKDTFYSNINIETVDNNSKLNLGAYDQLDLIHTMKDKAQLELRAGKFGAAWAQIDRIEGKDVKVSLTEGSQASLKIKVTLNYIRKIFIAMKETLLTFQAKSLI